MEKKFDKDLVKNIYEDFNHFRKNRKYIDFQLKVKSGQCSPVHKLLLLASCHAVKDLLQRQPDLNEYYLDIDIDPENLEILMEYVYTGTVKLTLKNVTLMHECAKTLVLAKEFHLEKITVDFMIKNIDIHQCLEFWRFAEKFQIERLKAECIKFFVLNFEKCLDANISVLQENEFKEITSDKRLKVAPEALYSCISKWIEKDIVDRSDHIMSLIENIDFNGVTPEYIKSKILNDTTMFNYKPFTEEMLKVLYSIKDRPPHETFETQIINTDENIRDEEILPKHNYEPALPKLSNTSNSIPDASNLASINLKPTNIYLVTENSFDKLEFHHKKIVNIYQMDPPKLKAHSVVSISSEEMFITGGMNSSYREFSLGYRILPFSNECIEFQPMKVARGYHRMCFINDQIYACGGCSCTYALFNGLKSVESFNLQKGYWIDQPPLKISKYSFSLVGTGNCLYAIGGQSSCHTLSDSVERLDVREKNWKVISKSGVYSFGKKSLHINDKIYCFDALGQGNIFDIRTNKWSGSMPKLPEFNNVQLRLPWQSFDIGEYQNEIYGVFDIDNKKKVYQYEYQYDKWIDLNISKEYEKFATTSLVVM